MAHTPTVRSHTRGTRKVPREVREQQMLEAAESAFAARGFHAASVDAIAEASGITKPMVYAYFGSKEGLYRACMQRARARLLAALRDGRGHERRARPAALARPARGLHVRRTRARLVGDPARRGHAGHRPVRAGGRRRAARAVRPDRRAAAPRGRRRGPGHLHARGRRPARAGADGRRRVARRLVGRAPGGARRARRARADELRLERPRRPRRGPHLDPADRPSRAAAPSRPAPSAPGCRRSAR